jgi:hypothetical protein
MKDSPRIDLSIPIVFGFFTILCLGFGIWFWSVEWPPSFLQIVTTTAGALIGVIYCIDRAQNWDVQAWGWHTTRRNRTYSPLAYRIAMIGGSLGVLVTNIARNFIGKEIRYGLLSAGLACIGIVCIWSVIECCRHLLYYRTKL